MTTNQVFLTDGNLSIINGTTNTVSSVVALGNSAYGLWVDQASGIVYVANSSPGTISVVRNCLPGDLNADGMVGLQDAVLALKVLANNTPSGIRSDYGSSGAEVDGDNKIGLAEIIYILQKAKGMRED